MKDKKFIQMFVRERHVAPQSGGIERLSVTALPWPKNEVLGEENR